MRQMQDNPSGKITDIPDSINGLNISRVGGIKGGAVLAAADVRVFMGSKGMEVAIETTDINPIPNDSFQLPFLPGFKKTGTVIKRNISFSLFFQQDFRCDQSWRTVLLVMVL